MIPSAEYVNKLSFSFQLTRIFTLVGRIVSDFGDLHHPHSGLQVWNLIVWNLRSQTKTYLCFWNDGAVFGWGSEEGGEGCGHDERTGSNEATQVAARDIVLLFLHYQRVHYVEDIPRDPYCAELCQKWRPLEAQCQWRTTIGQNVKPAQIKQGCIYKYQYLASMNIITLLWT